MKWIQTTRGVCVALVVAAIGGGTFHAAAQQAPPTPAQQVRDWKTDAFGIYGGILSHESSGDAFNFLTCSTLGSDGDSEGWTAGFLYQVPLSQSFAAMLRLGYVTIGNEKQETENIGNAVENNSTVNATSQHSFDFTIGAISLEPQLMIRPFPIPLNIHLGAQFGFIIQRDANYTERLIAPAGAVFTNGTTERNSQTGGIDNASPAISAIPGLSYDIPIARSLVLAPEVAYHIDLVNSPTLDPDLSTTFRVGLALKYGPGNIIETPASKPSTSPIAAAVQATGLFNDGSEKPVVQVRVEENLGSQLRPLLNYVFFDENSDEIPERYAMIEESDARAFSVESLHYLDVLQTYHQLLNIVGRRMLQNPTATLRIVGRNSDEGEEKGNTTLSRNRALAVREYLYNVWGIEMARMPVEAGNLPDKPSNVAEPDGIVENRRVELYSDNPAILEPVFTSDTTRTANPPSVRFRASAQPATGVARWRMTASQAGRTLKEFSGEGPLPAQLDWRIDEDQSRTPKVPSPIDYQLEVEDSDGNIATTPLASIPTDLVTIQRKRRERIADKEIGRYSLILFDFGKAEIGEANRRILEFVKGRVTLNSTVTITGHTDRVGDPATNKKLSQDRAAAVASALTGTKPTTQGLGESQLLFSNDLPEGRFYCRIVDIVVETPITE
ncbi:MAG: hypothetical protein DYG96_05055 [Chlorobi bacterium CHB2]|nr:hypothetical protein [Chlorobi bacterium CHB2]